MMRSSQKYSHKYNIGKKNIQYEKNVSYKYKIYVLVREAAADY